MSPKDPREMTLDERKVDLVKSLFLESADDDYITARWAYSHAKQQIFFWHAAQSLEKLMKAVLLLNNESVIEYEHDIPRLWARLCELDVRNRISRDIPKHKGTALLADIWEAQPVTDFVKLVHYYGSPDARYGSLGTKQGGPLYSILDKIYFEIRLFAKDNNFTHCDLYTHCGQDWTISGSKVPPSWALSDDLTLERLYMRSYSVGDNEQLRSVFAAQNHVFFDPSEESAAQFGGIIEKGSPLFNHLVRMRTYKAWEDEEIPQDNTSIIDELTEWAQSSIKLPKELKKFL